jgi:hypothetical protein
MKSATLLLVTYAVSMVFYGSLEMTHDLLHYLADHHHSTLHSHSHDHGHSVHDHEPEHHHHDHASLSHDHETKTNHDEAFPSALNFFLFVQSKMDFRFNNSGWLAISPIQFSNGGVNDKPPITPPPEIFFTDLHSLRL